MSVRVQIVYEVDEDGWVVAFVPEILGVHSQGRTPEEACANAIDALHGMRMLRAGSEAR